MDCTQYLLLTDLLELQRVQPKPEQPDGLVSSSCTMPENGASR